MPIDLDALTPIHYLAHVLMAEQRRKELGLPENAPVMTTRWLVTRSDFRAKAVEDAKRWATKNMGSVAAAEDTARVMPSFFAWVAEETAQAAARAAATGAAPRP